MNGEWTEKLIWDNGLNFNRQLTRWDPIPTGRYRLNFNFDEMLRMNITDTDSD